MNKPLQHFKQVTCKELQHELCCKLRMTSRLIQACYACLIGALSAEGHRVMLEAMTPPSQGIAWAFTPN